MNEPVNLRDMFDTGAVVFIVALFIAGITLMWNSNQIYPPKPVAPVAHVDKYTIITSDGECWVDKLEDDGTLIRVMKGDYLGVCQMYLKNLNQ